jgi:hypothetical protein
VKVTLRSKAYEDVALIQNLFARDIGTSSRYFFLPTLVWS